MADEGLSAYSKRELARVAKAFSLMGDEAVSEAKNVAGNLAYFAANEIKSAARGRTKAARAVQAVADGAKVSKSSKTGRIDIGFASQRLSGGGNTQKLWAGLEFGSNRYKQFPSYSGRLGRGSRGWFIYPTLRRIQPELTKKWEDAADSIIKKWTA
jgi:hypothetical protein